MFLAFLSFQSRDMFRDGGRADLAAVEEGDLALIEEYLPKLADEATTQRWAEEAVAASGAAGPSQAGKAIGALMKEHRGEVDGKLAKDLVNKLLASL
jgi:uncharacterized protein